MEIIGDGGEKLKGYWTGNVKTKVKNSYLTVPVLVAYQVAPRWRLKAGPFVSYVLEGDFQEMYITVIYVKMIRLEIR